ncbi:MAG: redoxin domain-containing protein [Gemmataceae bacterium]
MRRALIVMVGLAVLAGATALWPSRKAEADAPKARKVKPFSLKDAEGKTWSLAEQKDRKAIVVLFLGTECPINNQYLPRLHELRKEYEPKGVGFVGVNSNVHDTPARVLGHVQANKILFPVLKDTGNVVADYFAARRTPEAFVISPTGEVLYQGRIDDQIGIGFKRKEPTRRDLAVALDEVLAGKPVSKPLVDAPGCLIARAKKPAATGSITFTKHISRILQNRCQECHRPGQVAPMPLISYEDALSWQEMIREVVDENRMPPWHADPKHGKFDNDRSLKKEEKEQLLAWIQQGCPKGDPADLPEAKKFQDGWLIGKPDLVLEMPREYTVPADAGPNGIKYQYFRVDTKFDEDRWIQAAECRPGSREVVHHIIIYVIDPARMGKGRIRGDARIGDIKDGIGNGFLAAYAPGDMPTILPPGHAKKLPRGAMLVFQMHYTPDGVERKDRSSVGLIFAKEPPKYEVRTRGVSQQMLLIPPGAKHHEVKSKKTFDQNVRLLSLLPHMHLRGKDFLYEAVFPDGRRETLLSIPRYDFNWQSNYRLEKPLDLPAGSRIECTAHFDNSTSNPNNPNPSRFVFWGDQTWEEMMIGFVDYAFERK